jgi:hypothetical protein
MAGTMGAHAIHGFIMVATRLPHRSSARAQNPPRAEVPIGDRLPPSSTVSRCFLSVQDRIHGWLRLLITRVLLIGGMLSLSS